MWEVMRYGEQHCEDLGQAHLLPRNAQKDCQQSGTYLPTMDGKKVGPVFLVKDFFLYFFWVEILERSATS